jgi:hypothetical protein
VGAGIDVVRGNMAPADYALGIDHEQRPAGGAFLSIVHAVKAGDLPFGLEIRQQREAQLASLRVGAMRPQAVYGYAQQLRLVLFEE